MVMHLLQDVGVTGLIDLEGLVAMRANDLVHGDVLSGRK